MHIRAAAGNGCSSHNPMPQLRAAFAHRNLQRMNTTLSLAQKKYLRSLGHELKPVLIVGNAGVTPAVVREAMVGLAAHELLKVRLRVGERDARDAAIDALLEATGAILVQRIGHIALIYRRHPERPGIILPSGA